MSARESMNSAQFGAFYHVSPHSIPENAYVTPMPESHQNFPQEKRDGDYAHFTADPGRAEWYRDNFEETAADRGFPADHQPHVYEVQPTGPFHRDPNDAQSLRSAHPLRVLRKTSIPDQQEIEDRDFLLSAYNYWGEERRAGRGWDRTEGFAGGEDR